MQCLCPFHYEKENLYETQKPIAASYKSEMSGAVVNTGKFMLFLLHDQGFRYSALHKHFVKALATGAGALLPQIKL